MVELSEQAFIELRDTIDALFRKNDEAMALIETLISATGYLAAIVNELNPVKAQKALSGLKAAAERKSKTHGETNATTTALRILSAAFLPNLN